MSGEPVFYKNKFDPSYIPVLDTEETQSLVKIETQCRKASTIEARIQCCADSHRKAMQDLSNPPSLKCCLPPGKFGEGLPTWPPPPQDAVNQPFPPWNDPNFRQQHPGTIPPFNPLGSGGYKRPTGVGKSGDPPIWRLLPPGGQTIFDGCCPDQVWPYGTKSPFQQSFDECMKFMPHPSSEEQQEGWATVCLLEVQDMWDEWSNNPSSAGPDGYQCCQAAIDEYNKRYKACVKSVTGRQLAAADGTLSTGGTPV